MTTYHNQEKNMTIEHFQAFYIAFQLTGIVINLLILIYGSYLTFRQDFYLGLLGIAVFPLLILIVIVKLLYGVDLAAHAKKLIENLQEREQ